MAINGHRNKPSDPGAVPGASTRTREPAVARFPAGAKQDRRGRKGWAFARHGIHRYRAKHIVANDNYAEARLAA